MLQYTGKETIRECKICKSVFRFHQIENQENGNKYYEGMDLHRIYKIPDENRGEREIFVCGNCVSFIESIIDNRITHLQSGKKVEETDGK